MAPSGHLHQASTAELNDSRNSRERPRQAGKWMGDNCFWQIPLPFRALFRDQRRCTMTEWVEFRNHVHMRRSTAYRW